MLDDKEHGQGENRTYAKPTVYSPHSHSIVPGGFEVMS
jgi:hypothetical protein